MNNKFCFNRGLLEKAFKFEFKIPLDDKKERDIYSQLEIRCVNNKSRIKRFSGYADGLASALHSFSLGKNVNLDKLSNYELFTLLELVNLDNIGYNIIGLYDISWVGKKQFLQIVNYNKEMANSVFSKDKYSSYTKRLHEAFKFNCRNRLSEDDKVQLVDKLKTYKDATDTRYVDMLCGALYNMSNTIPIHLNAVSDGILYSILELVKYDSYKGNAYISNFKIEWLGEEVFDTIFIKTDNKSVERTNSEDRNSKVIHLKDVLLNSQILQLLKRDVSNIELLDSDSYTEYINSGWRTYGCCTFAKKGIYRLDLVCTGILDPVSIENRMVFHVPLNDHLGFRVVNIKTEKILKVDNYSRLKRILNT